MPKSKINQTIRKSVEGILNLDNDDIVIEIEDAGEKSFKELFEKFNGENVKIIISVSNDE